MRQNLTCYFFFESQDARIKISDFRHEIFDEAKTKGDHKT